MPNPSFSEAFTYLRVVDVNYQKSVKDADNHDETPKNEASNRNALLQQDHRPLRPAVCEYVRAPFFDLELARIDKAAKLFTHSGMLHIFSAGFLRNDF